MRVDARHEAQGKSSLESFMLELCEELFPYPVDTRVNEIYSLSLLTSPMISLLL